MRIAHSSRRVARALLLLGAVGGSGLSCHRSREVTPRRDQHLAEVEEELGAVQTTRGTTIALLYSSNLQGEYEHCGCPSHPLGGLVRRATVIDRARAESDGALVVDAGDMLLPSVFHDEKKRPPDAAEIERRARLLLGAYARMGIQALLPAERDLAIGPAKLKQLLKATRVPAVASNLFTTGGASVFARDRLLTIAGVSFGIFGVVQPQSEDAALWERWKIEVADPTLVARQEVASLKDRGAQVIVALLHLGPRGAAERLLRAVPGITFAVQGHSEQQLEAAEDIGGARLVEAMATGKLAGRLDLHVVDGVTTFSDKGARTQVLTMIADHRRQLADLERRAAEDKTEQLRDYYKLRREGIAAAIKRESELARRLPTIVRGSWFENQIIPLDDSIPDHPGVALLTAAYNAENVRRGAEGLPVGIAMVDPLAPFPVPPPAPTVAVPGAGAVTPSTYAGSLSCAACHEGAWKNFQSTKHASALTALVPSQRQHDPSCVGCHTTGYLAPGGAATIREATSRLKDVGCESCHGPGLAHLTSGDRKGTIRRAVGETVCRGCHTPDQTNGEFDYERFRRAILGMGHGA